MVSSARALEWATRIGFAARGIMYGLIGYLALRSGRTEDGSGVHSVMIGGRMVVEDRKLLTVDLAALAAKAEASRVRREKITAPAE